MRKKEDQCSTVGVWEMSTINTTSAKPSVPVLRRGKSSFESYVPSMGWLYADSAVCGGELWSKELCWVFLQKKPKKTTTTQKRRLKTLNSITIMCYMNVETLLRRLCTHDTFPAQSITICDFWYSHTLTQACVFSPKSARHVRAWTMTWVEGRKR